MCFHHWAQFLSSGRMSKWWKNTETVGRYSSKYILSNVNQVETFWPCYCCSLPKMQITHSVSHRHMLFFAIPPLWLLWNSKPSFLYVCSSIPASVLLLLLSTQRSPACSTLTFAAVLHPSKLHCSTRPLLDCVWLTALRPRGSPGQWPSTKAPGASSTSATKFP